VDYNYSLKLIGARERRAQNEGFCASHKRVEQCNYARSHPRPSTLPEAVPETADEQEAEDMARKWTPGQCPSPDEE